MQLHCLLSKKTYDLSVALDSPIDDAEERVVDSEVNLEEAETENVVEDGIKVDSLNPGHEEENKDANESDNDASSIDLAVRPRRRPRQRSPTTTSEDGEDGSNDDDDDDFLDEDDDSSIADIGIGKDRGVSDDGEEDWNYSEEEEEEESGNRRATESDLNSQVDSFSPKCPIENGD